MLFRGEAIKRLYAFALRLLQHLHHVLSLSAAVGFSIGHFHYFDLFTIFDGRSAGTGVWTPRDPEGRAEAGAGYKIIKKPPEGS